MILLKSLLQKLFSSWTQVSEKKYWSFSKLISSSNLKLFPNTYFSDVQQKHKGTAWKRMKLGWIRCYHVEFEVEGDDELDFLSLMATYPGRNVIIQSWSPHEYDFIRLKFEIRTFFWYTHLVLEAIPKWNIYRSATKLFCRYLVFSSLDSKMTGDRVNRDEVRYGVNGKSMLCRYPAKICISITDCDVLSYLEVL